MEALFESTHALMPCCAADLPQCSIGIDLDDGAWWPGIPWIHQYIFRAG